MDDKIFDGLNDRQREAVNCLEGPLLVMAGAGSGKTRVLTCRVANLLANGVKPWNILAITFTNKAANEMKSRAAKMIGASAREVWLSTFHSFCARILRADIESIGVRGRSFVIYDTSDSRALIRDILKELDLDDKRFVPSMVHGRISFVKNMLLDVDDFAASLDDEQSSYAYDMKIVEVYREYEKRMLDNNALDFDDLLLFAVRMLEDSPEVLRKYQNRFKYILIDEYQDTNVAQYRLTQLLAAAHHNICVVGDADQSIYGFRGADVGNILSFERDYPEAHVVLLEQNYRSTKMILNAANAVIENNDNRKPKKLWTLNPTGDRITLIEVANERVEARRIVDEITSLRDQKFHFKDIALLYRTNAQSRSLEEAFMSAGVPYVIIGGLKFYDRKEIKDIIAYLRLICNLRDSVSLLRIINAPRRGIGPTTLNKLNQFASNSGLTLFDIISDVEILMRTDLSHKAKQNIYQFAEFILDCINRQHEMSVPDFVLHVLDASGYLPELRSIRTPENEARIENLGEFVNVAKEFIQLDPNGKLDDFLNHIALINDLDNLDDDKDRVSLMTVHSAKGLEFPAVFVTGLEEGLFPHASSMYKEDQLEEERRAAYVAITRAQKKLYLTYAATRMTFGKERANVRSRFIDEIPAQLLNIEPLRRVTVQRSLFDMPTSRPSSGSTTGSSTGSTPRSSKVISFDDAKSARIKPNVNEQWRVGDRARHGKWGEGTITKVAGDGSNAQLTIRFDDASIGEKHLVVQYAPITKI
ncbi:MAG: DNA helicase PcrA [Selenomonadaceae bacterium]|nr:DNA helicase PcrA [Selenomonadaceae bacterium]